MPPPQSEETSKVHVSGEVANAPQNTLENGRTRKFASASGVMHDLISLKEPASQGSIPVAKDVLQQKPVSGEAGNVSIVQDTCVNLLLMLVPMISSALLSVSKSLLRCLWL